MKKANLGLYIKKINDIVTQSEEVGDEMNSSYELIRQAIDEDKLSDVTDEQLKSIKELFSAGTDKYRILLSEIKSLKAPIKVLGIHKKLEKAFTDYVEGCQEMVDSIETNGVKQQLFDDSEIKQDESTAVISFCIQRITQIIVG